MKGKRSASFQHARHFRQKHMIVLSGNVVVDIVDGHRIEALVGEIRLHFIAASEQSIFYNLRCGNFSRSGIPMEADSLP